MNRKANSVNGDRSVALGLNSEATGNSSVGIGNECKATGHCSVAIGNNCEALSSCVAIGHYTRAKNNYSVSLGIENDTLNWNSCAIGGYNKS